MPDDSSLRFISPGDVYNATPPRIVFGRGVIGEIAAEAARLGAQRVLIVSTAGRHAIADAIGTGLGSIVAGILPEAVSQVPIELAHRGRALARSIEADCLVSVGGGSSIGLGKAIALEIGMPIIAVPTTYSGSEMTGFCGITIDGVKRMHTSLRMLAKTVIYDPDLTLSLPLDVTASSAMNALAHCLDAVYVRTASPIIALAAFDGARRVVSAIRDVMNAPGDVEARARLFYGAFLAGAALTGGFALQHGLAHTLGGSFGVSHGLSHAIVLPHVAAYNSYYARKELVGLAHAIGTADIGRGLFDLIGDLDLPRSLADVGIRELDLSAIAEITVETDNGLNPGPVTVESLTAIARAAFNGELAN